MISLFDFSKNIASLKKDKRYPDALSYFKKHREAFSNEQIANNEYIISDIITCLRCTGRFVVGFKFLDYYKIEIDSSQKERIVTAYGWMLWSKFKHLHESDTNLEDENTTYKEEEPNNKHQHVDSSHAYKDEIVVRILKLIPILLNFESDFSKTLVSNLFSTVIKTEKNKAAPNWKLINEFCDIINPNYFSKNTSTVKVKRKGQLKDMELASDFENWYAFKTKALLKLGQWEACFQTSKEALENINDFHYSNEIWFSRRIAICKKNLGNTEETIKEFEKILKKKKEWFIQKELSELYYEIGENDSAFKMAIDAINSYGSIEYKVDLLLLLGRILLKKDQKEQALKHIVLSKLIRQSEDWKIPQQLTELLEQFPAEDAEKLDLDKLKSELIKYWKGFNSNTINKQRGIKSKPLSGEVIKILHDNNRGKDGFIKYNNEEYYFSIPTNFYLTPDIKHGSKVSFVISSSQSNKQSARIVKLKN